MRLGNYLGCLSWGKDKQPPFNNFQLPIALHLEVGPHASFHPDFLYAPHRGFTVDVYFAVAGDIIISFSMLFDQW